MINLRILELTDDMAQDKRIWGFRIKVFGSARYSFMYLLLHLASFALVVELFTSHQKFLTPNVFSNIL